MKTILIATTNAGKYAELVSLFKNLPIQCISLDELGKKIPAPDETESTIEGNALLKAKYYAKESGYITVADDGGLYIDALNGWPGVQSARIAPTTTERIQEVLRRLDGIENRNASFRGVLAICNPKNNDVFISEGETKGVISTNVSGEHGFGFDPIFYIPEVGKTYAELTDAEKNKVSHRGKSSQGIKRFIINTYGGEHVVVPIGIIVKDGKILLNKRNDSEKPELHGLWEFPGGGMEIGETVEENVIREIREECGYEVDIISKLRLAWTVQITNPRSTHYGVQIYLLPYVCRITAGAGVVNDDEVLETAWVAPEEVHTYNLIGENKKMYEKIYLELNEVIKNHQL